MKYSENITEKMDLKAKIIIVASIFIAFFVILLPIWQKGLTREAHYEILIAETKLERMEEEERNLVAYILEKETSEEGSSTNLFASL